MRADYAIETAGLEKLYSSRFRGRKIKAVSDLTIQVPSGVKYGLLGPNGAGKTTFVKMLLSAVQPTAGTATIFGRDSRLPEARRPVGYLPENHRFPTYLTGSGMLDFYASLSGVSLESRRRRVPELLELVGLKGWGDVRIKKYSKGMLQRLGLAQALMHRPKLLVLDEPTDGVDPVGRRDIRGILDRLTGKGVTVFINSHLLAEVESFCEYVAILHKGRLALEGKISSLLSERGYQICAREVPDSVLLTLRQSGAAVSIENHRADLRLSSIEEANRAIDAIRASGGLVESLEKSTGTLEDVFMRVTAAERAA